MWMDKNEELKLSKQCTCRKKVLLSSQRETRDAEDLPEFKDWCRQRGEDMPQFHYWATVLELELLVLVYVRSLRQGSLMLYLDALTQLAPWFHALDHIHYAR